MAKGCAAQLSLIDIYGPGLALCPRPFPAARSWLPQDPIALEMLTGTMLAVSGAMPVLAAASVTPPASLALLREAGFAAPRVLRFRNDADHDRHMARLQQDGMRLALQHAPPADDRTPRRYWIDPQLLRDLNNKAHLAELVEPEFLPQRRLLSPAELVTLPTDASWPLVVKVATAESTGGGIDVAICRNDNELRRARRTFRNCRQLVVEEYLPMRRNLCLNFAVSPQGRLNYIGSAEQITDRQGNYSGNWLDGDSQAPPAAIEAGRRIVEKAFGRGYWGCVGIDMALLADGRIRVYDLNFRLNGSTPALLLADRIRAELGLPVLRLAQLRCAAGFDAMIVALRAALRRGLFVPLVTCDPRISGRPAARARAGGLIPGDSRDHIAQRRRELQGMGLDLIAPCAPEPQPAPAATSRAFTAL